MTYAWFDAGDGRKVYRRVPGERKARSDLPRPYLRPDGMSDVWNPVDGRHYDSKSAYERAVKAAGCEIVGNDAGHWQKPFPTLEPEGVREDVIDAWNALS